MQMQKQKVIIFGSGQSGYNSLRWLERQDDCDVICFVDNNSKKYATKYCGKTVEPPTVLEIIDYDCIYVASDWYQDILQQLLNLGVNTEKISIVQKSIRLGWSFHSEYSCCFMINKLRAFDVFLKGNKVDYFIYGGALLGLIRENRFLPWDYDVDIFIASDNHVDPFEKAVFGLLHLLKKADDCELNIEKTIYDGETIGFPKNQVSRIIVRFERGGKVISQLDIVRLIYNEDVCLWADNKASYFAPRRIFEGHRTIVAYGHKFPIPALAEDLLSLMYGNWEKPNKEWDGTCHQLNLFAGTHAVMAETEQVANAIDNPSGDTDRSTDYVDKIALNANLSDGELHNALPIPSSKKTTITP